MIWLKKRLFVLFLFEAAKNELTKEREANTHRIKLAELGELAAGVGHEINNPLTIIAGNLALIEKRMEKNSLDPQSLQKHLSRSLIACNRIKEIVKTLRNYARTNNDETVIFNLTTACTEIIDLVKNIYSSAGITIHFSSADPEIWVDGNYGEMQQILMNLLQNAFDALESSEDKKISIAINNNLGGVQLSVSDTGSGILPEHQERIFEPFWTSKEIGKGTGLGLGLVSRFVENMNGTISFKSKLNQGTKFTISLPKAKPVEKEDSSKDVI